MRKEALIQVTAPYLRFLSMGANVQWVSQYPYECELIYPPCTYLTCENVTTRKEGNLAGIRCLSVRATVSTARKEVDNIRTVKDKPHEDASNMDSAQVVVNIFENVICFVR